MQHILEALISVNRHLQTQLLICIAEILAQVFILSLSHLIRSLHAALKWLKMNIPEASTTNLSSYWRALFILQHGFKKKQFRAVMTILFLLTRDSICACRGTSLWLLISNLMNEQWSITWELVRKFTVAVSSKCWNWQQKKHLSDDLHSAGWSNEKKKASSGLKENWILIKRGKLHLEELNWRDRVLDREGKQSNSYIREHIRIHEWNLQVRES